jgi:hypothetical protein
LKNTGKPQLDRSNPCHQFICPQIQTSAKL